jgi:hypothetical protein
VTDRNWIPFATAVVILNRDGHEPLQRALMRGDVASRGVPVLDDRSIEEGYGQAVEIEPEHWGVCTFNLKHQTLDPPSKRRISTGFRDVRISRVDVERMALATEPTARSGKRHAVNSAIQRLGLTALLLMSQKEREPKIIAAVKEASGLSVSPRTVRDLLSEARLGKPSA